MVTGISLVSCHDDLYLAPVSSLTAGSFWKTSDDAEAGLNGMYVRLRDQAYFNFYYWGEVRSGSQSPFFGTDALS